MKKFNFTKNDKQLDNVKIAILLNDEISQLLIDEDLSSTLDVNFDDNNIEVLILDNNMNVLKCIYILNYNIYDLIMYDYDEEGNSELTTIITLYELKTISKIIDIVKKYNIEVS